MTMQGEPQLHEILHNRSGVVADVWYEIVKQSALAVHTPSAVRRIVSNLAERATALLLSGLVDRPAAEAIGASLVPLRLEAESFGRMLEELALAVTEGLAPDLVVRLRPRIAALSGGMAAGYVRSLNAAILEQQEEIRSAYLRQIQRAQRELRLKHAGIESSINAICFSDPSGKVTYVNPAFLAMWGYSDPGDVIGRSVADFWMKRRRALGVLHALDERGGWIGELVAERQDGSHFDAQVSASMIRDDEGRVLQLMASFVDISERKRAQQALERHVARLRILREIDRAILAARSPEEIGRAALRRVEQLVSCDIASIALFDFEAGEANLVWIQQDDVTLGLENTLSIEGLEQGLEAFRSDEALLTDDLMDLFEGTAAVEAMQTVGIDSALVVPLVSRGELIGTLNLAAVNPDAFESEAVDIACEIADSLSVAIQHSRLNESVRRQGEQLREAMARLAEAEEAERRRVVRALHDRVGQNLTALDLNLNLVRSQMDREEAQSLCNRIDESLALVEETNKRIRRVMTDLRPAILDDYGLLPALRWYGERYAARTGIRVEVDAAERLPELPARVEDALFRISQEALTNAAKHARATQVAIELSADDEATRLVIVDDGVGFHPDNAGKGHGWGLLTMHERARAVSADCRVEPCADQGTRVVVEVPR